MGFSGGFCVGVAALVVVVSTKVGTKVNVIGKLIAKSVSGRQTKFFQKLSKIKTSNKSSENSNLRCNH